MNGILKAKNIVTILTIINVAVFFLQSFTDLNLIIFALIPSFVAQGYFFQLFTYMFLHGSFLHIFINMYILMIFGTAVEEVWGSKKFLRYYLITGIGAGLCIFIVNYFVFPDLRMIPTIGASGAIFGLLLAFGVLYPNNTILLFFIIPMKAKYMVVLYGAFELYRFFTYGGDTGISHVGHLGGLLFGIIYFMFIDKKSRKPSKTSRIIRSKLTKTVNKQVTANEVKKEDINKLNAVLNKLEQSDSLSDNEYQIVNYHNIMNDGKGEISCNFSDFNNSDSYCQKCEDYIKCILRKINSLL
jgi:membrane associated rhomboid family serine protease